MTLPQPLALILPLIVAPLAGWLGSDGLPKWLNELITLIILAIAVIAWSIIGGKMTPDVIADVMLVAAYTSALVATGPLAPLRQWMIAAVPSPLAWLAPKPKQPTPVTGGRASQAIIAPKSVTRRSITADTPQTTLPTLPVTALPGTAPSGAQIVTFDEVHGG